MLMSRFIVSASFFVSFMDCKDMTCWLSCDASKTARQNAAQSPGVRVRIQLRYMLLLYSLMSVVFEVIRRPCMCNNLSHSNDFINHAAWARPPPTSIHPVQWRPSHSWASPGACSLSIVDRTCLYATLCMQPSQNPASLLNAAVSAQQ